MRLIGLTGVAGSGKDTVADILCELYGMKKTSFAKPIKDGCQLMFGLTDEQLYGAEKETIIPRYGKSARQIMQWAGTEFGRNMVHPDVWLIQVEEQWRDVQKADGEGLVVADVRFNNEADMIRENHGVIVHITGRDTRIKDTLDASHSSERPIQGRPGDLVMNNISDMMALRQIVQFVAEHQLGLTRI